MRIAGKAVLVALLAAGVQGCTKAHDIGSTALTDGGTIRGYRYYVPPRLRGSGAPLPAVLVLQGAGSSPDIMQHTHMNEVAERHGFVAVYPQATNDLWNDGAIEIAGRNPSNDVAYLRNVALDVVAKLSVDPRRIYVAGFSNGGTMALRLGCEAADLFAGVAAASAAMPAWLETRCNPSRPVPVLVMSGTDDPIMPYRGGKVRFLGVSFGEIMSVEGSAALWAQKNGCGAALPERRLSDRDPGDGTRAVQIDYAGCRAPVRVLRLEGAGHPWPNGLQYLPSFMVGAATRDVDGGDAAWAFFSSQ